MRLSERLKIVLINTLHNNFGQSDIYLFGSRADDTKKGGDIDLAIDSHLSKQAFKSKKNQFLTEIVRQGFDLKIDIVQYNSVDDLLLSEIKHGGIKL